MKYNSGILLLMVRFLFNKEMQTRRSKGTSQRSLGIYILQEEGRELETEGKFHTFCMP